VTKPRNTSRDDNIVKLAISASPGGIEAQERAGQAEVVGGTYLPTRLNHGEPEDFAALGFTFGDPDPEDPMFRPATLPDGWKREGSSHAMWSYIVDERGIRRVSIFYKAAFYDRSAFMNICHVGWEVATDFIYGEAEAPSLDRLTADELDDVREAAEKYLADATSHPDIYGDREPRARVLLAAVTA
jgi:hypothetical protein